MYTSVFLYCILETYLKPQISQISQISQMINLDIKNLRNLRNLRLKKGGKVQLLYHQVMLMVFRNPRLSRTLSFAGSPVAGPKR